MRCYTARVRNTVYWRFNKGYALFINTWVMDACASASGLKRVVRTGGLAGNGRGTTIPASKIQIKIILLAGFLALTA